MIGSPSTPWGACGFCRVRSTDEFIALFPSGQFKKWSGGLVGGVWNNWEPDPIALALVGEHETLDKITYLVMLRDAGKRV